VSFPGEHRKFVRDVVDRLAEVLGCDRVFKYDDETSTWSEACSSPDQARCFYFKLVIEDTFLSRVGDESWYGFQLLRSLAVTSARLATSAAAR